MPNTNVLDPNETQAASTTRQVAEAAFKIVFTGGAVATIFYIPDLVLQRKQTLNKNKSTNANVPSESSYQSSTRFASMRFAGAAVLARGYVHSAKAATLKSGMLSQRESLQKNLAEEKTDISLGEPEQDYGMQAKNLNKSALGQVAFVSGAIGLADTAITQYSANKRTWFLHKFNDANFSVPVPQTASEHLRVFKAGYGIRATRNVATVSGLLLSPYVQTKLTAVLSENQSEMAAACLSGAALGSMSNALDVIYKNQVIQVCPKSIKTPSFFAVTRSLVAAEGLKVLTRGYGISVGYTIGAYYLIPKVEIVAEQALPKVEYAARAVMGLFSRLSKPAASLKTSKKDKKEDGPHPFFPSI